MELIRRVLAWKRMPADAEPLGAADTWEATRQTRHAETVLAALRAHGAREHHRRRFAPVARVLPAVVEAAS